MTPRRRHRPLGSRLAPVSNFLVNNPLVRRLAGSLTGIDPRRKLPSSPARRFMSGREQDAGASGEFGAPKGKVVYFAGCTANYFDPAIGRSAVAVLERQGVDVVVPRTTVAAFHPSESGTRKRPARSTKRTWRGPAIRRRGVQDRLRRLQLRPHDAEQRPYCTTPETRKVAENVTDIASFLRELLRLQGGSIPAWGP